MRAFGRVVLGAVVVGVAAVAATRTLSPDPVVTEGPADFRAVVDDTIRLARDRLPEASECIAGVTIRPAWDLANRAEYDDAVITVRVPATAPRIEELVIHELAHHLDATCPAMDDVRDRFLDTVGATTAWNSGETWATTPSEQFAEALTLVALGRQRAHHVRVPPSAIELVRRWAAADR